MKCQANPVVVDAFKIIAIGEGTDNPGHADENGIYHLTLEDGRVEKTDSGMTARMEPKVGDYWVVQEDGYVYLNPASVFERKYSPLT